jgi:hypothetical protein
MAFTYVFTQQIWTKYVNVQCTLSWYPGKSQGKQRRLGNFSDGANLIGMVIKHKYHITYVPQA